MPSSPPSASLSFSNTRLRNSFDLLTRRRHSIVHITFTRRAVDNASRTNSTYCMAILQVDSSLSASRIHVGRHLQLLNRRYSTSTVPRRYFKLEPHPTDAAFNACAEQYLFNHATIALRVPCHLDSSTRHPIVHRSRSDMTCHLGEEHFRFDGQHIFENDRHNGIWLMV